jgi:hypothetical protein
MGAAPVAYAGEFVGLLTTASLAAFLGDRTPAEMEQLHVRDLPLERAMTLPHSMSASDALTVFQNNRINCAAVIDGGGSLLGLVSSADLACAVCRRVRPALIGGMATPFGVYLTGGGARGGVGNWALMSTGVYMAVLLLTAAVVSDWLLSLVPWEGVMPHWLSWLSEKQVAALLLYALFALFFRLSWVTGFHAAEHQVVHVLEAGEDLVPETVRRKPRVHPRCGTNLVAAVMIMSFFWESRLLEGAQPLPAMLVTLFLWRRVGGWLQQYITTRPASPRQLESGIRAARQLLDQFQRRGAVPQGPFLRIWNMGLLQVLSGWATVIGLLALLQWVLPLPDALRLF